MRILKYFLFPTLAVCFLAYCMFQKPHKTSQVTKKIINIQKESKEMLISPTDSILLDSSFTFYHNTLEKNGFNGAMLVARKGKILFEKYNGLRDIHSGNPIDSLTAFHLASISKTFTALGILKLWEESKLEIDSSVSHYLVNFPFKQIKIRDLLAHRSGLPHYEDFIDRYNWDSKKFISNKEMIDLMVRLQKKLKFGRPNKTFEYCNTNYAILAILIEKISSLSYPEFLNTYFFKPLGMKNSFVFTIEQSEKVLQSYKADNRKEPMMYLDAVYGDKNVYSTVRDLLKWDQALYEGKLFSKKCLDNAFNGYSFEKKGIRNYGLGWRLIYTPSGKKIIYHNGWWHGNNTVFRRLPEDSAVIIVLGNKYNEKIYESARITNALPGYENEIN